MGVDYLESPKNHGNKNSWWILASNHPLISTRASYCRRNWSHPVIQSDIYSFVSELASFGFNNQKPLLKSLILWGVPKLLVSSQTKQALLWRKTPKPSIMLSYQFCSIWFKALTLSGLILHSVRLICNGTRLVLQLAGLIMQRTTCPTLSWTRRPYEVGSLMQIMPKRRQNSLELRSSSEQRWRCSFKLIYKLVSC